MFLDKIVFEIPIYRISEDSFNKETENKRKKIKEDLPKVPGANVEKTVNDILDLYIYPYKYNEIVGYIELYILGTQIRADYWYCTIPRLKKPKKRLKRGITKKEFFWFGKQLEIGIQPELNNNEIFNLIIKNLKKLNRYGIFKNRYFDLEQLLILGKYIDWRNLMKDKEVNSFLE